MPRPICLPARFRAGQVLDHVLITVTSGSDPLRARRHTRELNGVLNEDRELRRHGITVELSARAQTDQDGAKGAVETLALIATAAATARPALDALVAALQAWLQRPDRSATITVTDGERSMTLDGEPSEEQLRAIREIRSATTGDPPQ